VPAVADKAVLAARRASMAAALLLDGGAGGGAADDAGGWRERCVQPGRSLAELLALFPDVVSAEAGQVVRVRQAAAGAMTCMQVYLVGTTPGLEVLPLGGKEGPEDGGPAAVEGWWRGEGEEEYELLAHWGAVGQVVRVRSTASWARVQQQLRACSRTAMLMEEGAVLLANAQ
jgi:hypothetical protein